MKRRLIKSAAFVRAAKRLVNKDSLRAADLRATLELLAEDAFRRLTSGRAI